MKTITVTIDDNGNITTVTPAGNIKPTQYIDAAAAIVGAMLGNNEAADEEIVFNVLKTRSKEWRDNIVIDREIRTVERLVEIDAALRDEED